jgi:hypothetical protein
MGSWQQAGRMLRGLRETRGWEVPKLAADLKAKATAVGQAVPDRQSLVRMIYEWEAGTHRPRAYYVLFVLVYATEEELVARTIKRGSELYRLMAALKAMGVPVHRRQFLLNAAALAGGIAGLPTVAVNLDGQERLVWVLKQPRSVDLPTAAFLRARTFNLMKQYEAVASPTSLLSQAAERLEQITLLREHAPLGRVQQELCRVEAQSAMLLGRLTWDVSGQHDHATAARYYDQAIAAAGNLRKAGRRRSRGCSSASCLSTLAMGILRTGCILPSGRPPGQQMALATLLPAGRRPLPPKRMRWLVRSGRSGCSWSGPTSTCRRLRPTIQCSGSLAGSNWAASSVLAFFA